MTLQHAITIAGRRIAADEPPYVIAELSANHNGKLDTALRIIDAAKTAGAAAVKLQTYRPDTITLASDAEPFRIHGGLWDGRTLYDLYQQAHMPWDWHGALFDHARRLGITIFSSPFDATAVDLLESLGAPAYKIASFEAVDLPLIRCVAATGKPMIISTGMASIAELDETVRAAREAGCKDLILLKCTSTYPATPENTNLRTIAHLREAFGCEVGLSDHTMGCGVALAAVAFGATVVEKHFTLRRSDGGVDSAFSLEPEEFRLLRVESERAWQGLGRIVYGGTQAEEKSRLFRRTLYVSQPMRRGDVFTPQNVRIVRPGLGLPPKFFELVMGKHVSRDCPPGTPLTWDVIA